MSATNIDIYLSELEVSKRDIKGAIQAKGVTPTGGLSSYAEAILSIPTGTEMAPLNETITESGVYNYNPIDDGVGGYNSVEINVDIPIPTFETQSKEVTIKKNGTTSIVPDSGYDGLSKVDVTVQVATGGSDKPQIFNGFAFTGGDIAQVDFSQYDWSLVYDTSYFFQGCTHSTGDWSNFLENFNGEILSGYYMFQNFSGTSFPNIDRTLYLVDGMFNGCKNLTTIPQLDTSNVTSMSVMFGGCTSLTTAPQLDTSNVVDMSYMFQSCSKLTTIPQLDTSNVTSMTNMFKECPQLIELPDFNCVKVASFGGPYSIYSWLYSSSRIQKIGIVDCDSVTNIGYFFGGSTQTYLTDFGGCRNLGKASSVSNTNSSYFMNYAPNLTYESVMNVINGLYDRATAGLSVLTLKLHANHLAMLSADDIAIATNKGWTIV